MIDFENLRCAKLNAAAKRDFDSYAEAVANHMGTKR
jgi:hypothetical protein